MNFYAYTVYITYEHRQWSGEGLEGDGSGPEEVNGGERSTYVILSTTKKIF